MDCLKRSIWISIFVFFPYSAFGYYGLNFSHVFVAKEPSSLRGDQFMLSYAPDKLNWEKYHLYFDGGISHFHETRTPYHTTLNVYSIAPVFRYTFNKRGFFLPYLEISIGVAYLNHTYIEHRNLGMHFAFQDRIGIGALLGQKKQLSIGIHAAHYSNAHLCGHNSGITIPVLFDIGYRFL